MAGLGLGLQGSDNNPRIGWWASAHLKKGRSMGGAETIRRIAVVVLAAGQGTRMRSRRAKVLHEICGVPMLSHIQAVAGEIEPERLIVVVGRGAEAVSQILGESAELVVQAEQKGTGHAVMMAEESLADFDGDVLVLNGDTPLLRADTCCACAI